MGSDIVSLLDGLGTMFQPAVLIYLVAGGLIGTFVGILPGLGPAVTMAILLPVVYGLGDPVGAMVMFSAIFYGAMYSGAVTSILLGTPGEDSAIVSILDGYPMARKGRPGAALLGNALAHFCGAAMGVIGIVLLARPLAEFGLRLSATDMIALVTLALCTIALLGGGVLRGLFSAAFGLALGTVGAHAISGTDRFDFGLVELSGGIDAAIVALGLFALSEVVFVLSQIRGSDGNAVSFAQRLRLSRDEARRSVGATIQGGVTGFLVGVLPGAGGTSASFLSYGIAKRLSKRGKQFGTGMIEGVVAPAASTSASAMGSMVPLLTLGIPGSVATAVMLGGLQGFGVQTGPLLIQTNPVLVWTVIAGLFVGNFLCLLLNLPMLRIWITVLKVPSAVLYPAVVVIAVVGAFSLSRSTIDLYLFLGFGVVGVLFRHCGISLPPAILALLLGPILENQFGRALTESGGEVSVLFDTPLAVGCYVVAALILLLPLFGAVRARVAARRNPKAGTQPAPADEPDDMAVDVERLVEAERPKDKETL